ncbi:MMPL family transporter [Thalassoroseus pseudoceratinae]|uniref:MMPL family transporter n=1 Tax=Thalassoroseus pseudoceratinae TaxID=2713176 RepID=UPI00141FD5EF|nr:MMPL family transporter [Thalassoroseus pseudoceratinae]
MNANPLEVADRWRYAFIGGVLAISLSLVIESFSWWSIDNDRGIETSLPASLPSQQAETLYKQAFSSDLMSNSLFIVLRRTGRQGGLRPADRVFVEDTLQPALEALTVPGDEATRTRVVKNVRTANNKYIGPLLDSDDEKATLVAVELQSDLDDQETVKAIDHIEQLIAQREPLASSPLSLFRKGVIPPGLSMEMSGIVGFTRDINRANKSSVRSIELWSLLGLGILLILTQKSPVLVVIPLLVVFLSVHAALGVLTLTTRLGWLFLYSDIRCYAAVVFYGVAAEHCLRLLIRYRRQLEHQRRSANTPPKFSWHESRPILIATLTMVGISAALLLADFGRFQQVGAVLVVGLVITWLTTSILTFGVMWVLRHWIFWPNRSRTRFSTRRSWLRSRRQTPGTVGGGFELQSPWMTCGLVLAVVLPFAILTVFNADRTTYSLLNVLPIHAPSVIGAEAAQQHFPPGATSPITILLEDKTVEFNAVDGKKLVADLTKCMASASETHGILDVRSLAFPLGLREERKIEETVPFRMLRHRAAVSHYVADNGRWDGHVTKLDVIVDENPFSRSGFQEFERLQSMVHDCLPPELSDARVHFLGATARIYDLQTVDQHDRVMVQIVSVLLAACLSWVAVRRASAVCVLVCSGLLCWLATMGVCAVVLRDVVAGGPYELDWQVVTLSFTILFAVVFPGNLVLVRSFLTTGPHSPSEESEGVFLGGLAMIVCSLSMFASDVLGLQQLGLAMVVGMIITTTLIRPFFIPSWMRMLNTNSNDTDDLRHNGPSDQIDKEPRTEYAGTDSAG